MSITAMDIQQQGFEHSLRGYDVEQVDVFLERVAQEVDELVKENESLKAQLEGIGVSTAPSAPVTVQIQEGDDSDTMARIQQAEATARAAADQARAIAAQAKATEDELAAAKATIADMEKRLAEKASMDATISNAFISAQRAADTMLVEAQASADSLKEEARAEGERIYRESEAKARDFIREALVEKQRIVDETAALATSCDNFRAEYRALLDRFCAEADRNFSEIDTTVVSEAAVQAQLPVVEGAPIAEPASIDDDDMIEEID